MRILFYSNQLDERGTTVALFDYAHYNETILGNESYIAAPFDSNIIAYEKFEERFPGRVLLHRTHGEIRKHILHVGVDVTYYIKAGIAEPFPSKNLTRNVVHAVFNFNEPHGDQYAYVSEWLAEQNAGVYVPHIVHLPEIKGDYRRFLNIPEDAIVFGRYGGLDQFDVPYLSQVIRFVVDANPKVYFLLMNTKQLDIQNKQVMYMDATTDMQIKRCFLNTLNGFLHGRLEGESFGLSISEACFANLPVITNIDGRDKNHLRILKDQGYYYSSANELAAILTNFKRKQYNYTQLVKQFAPVPVMRQFEQVFLN